MPLQTSLTHEMDKMLKLPGLGAFRFELTLRAPTYLRDRYTAFVRSVQCTGHKEPGAAFKATVDVAAKLANGTISWPAMLWLSPEVEF